MGALLLAGGGCGGAGVGQVTPPPVITPGLTATSTLAATAGKPFEAAVSSDGTVFVSVTADMAQDIGQPQAAVLRARTLAASDKAPGVVWFERDKNPQQLTLRAFVDDEIFEFPLSFPPHN